MNYESALEYIHAVQWAGHKPGLSRTRTLLAAQMDLALGETARAANELQLYTSYVQEFAAWVRRNYMPVGSGKLLT